MVNISRGKMVQNNFYQVSGYAVTRKGYTRSAQVRVEAINRGDAIIRATAQLRWEGLTHFKVLKVLEIITPLFSNKH